MKSSTEKTKGKQKLYFMILFAVFFLFIFYITIADFGVSSFFGKSEEEVQVKKADLNLNRSDSQKIWRNKQENDLEGLKNKVEFLTATLLEGKKSEERDKRKKDKISEEINALRKEVAESKKVVHNEAKAQFVEGDMDYNSSPFKYSESSSLEVRADKPPLEIISIKKDLEKKLKNVCTHIPAGTTVRAVILSSVDAPCGIHSMTDPQPVKMRIIDNAHLPKALESKIKDSIVLAIARGEISSERVTMRLDRLTTFERCGNFLDTEIAGYVSGEDGINGVRGIVVDKSSKMISNAALSGIFSGFSDYLQSIAITRKNCTCGVCAICVGGGMTPTEIAKYSGSKGLGNASDMLTDYFIKRAEQIQPVISVGAGRVVDITFIKTVKFGAEKTREETKEEIKKEIKKEEEGFNGKIRISHVANS